MVTAGKKKKNIVAPDARHRAAEQAASNTGSAVATDNASHKASPRDADDAAIAQFSLLPRCTR